MKIELIEQMAEAGNKATASGAALGLYGWMVSSGFLGLVGAAVAVLGLLVNLFFKIQSNRRARHLYLLKIERMRNGAPVPSMFGTEEADE